jgi:hypothetical protein
MNSDKIQELIDHMEPEEAASALSVVLRKILPLLTEETRLNLISNLVDTPSHEKVSSLVHL